MLKKNLTITPSVPAWIDGKSVVFDRKFYDGMLLYVKEWHGTVSCVMRKSDGPLPDFGFVKKTIGELPFQLTILLGDELITEDHIKNASIVLASGDSFNQLHLSKLCKKLNIKCVYVIEYIPETRHQILDLAKVNPVVKLRRRYFLWNGERKRVAAFQAADGIQANGTAAYDEYNRFKNCILYFDTRVNTDVIVSNEKLNERIETLMNNQPIRLAFSGRLIRMKGADDLIELAGLLKDRNIKFKMAIYGTGDLEGDMVDKINDMRLNSEVNMAGVVDFYNELLPEIKGNVDLFVMLHRQSDPSCTYLETLSCGIPIVGYENKAFSGLLAREDVGWGKKIDDLHGIADIIEHLNNSREQIKEKSINSVNFSCSHDFESTFQKRIEQLRLLVE
jgi:colanic acid/amylovoran biosynthesis glycosyltransferase